MNLNCNPKCNKIVFMLMVHYICLIVGNESVDLNLKEGFIWTGFSECKDRSDVFCLICVLWSRLCLMIIFIMSYNVLLWVLVLYFYSQTSSLLIPFFTRFSLSLTDTSLFFPYLCQECQEFWTENDTPWPSGCIRD